MVDVKKNFVKYEKEHRDDKKKVSPISQYRILTGEDGTRYPENGELGQKARTRSKGWKKLMTMSERTSAI